jgi:hypothetical protein
MTRYTAAVAFCINFKLPNNFYNFNILVDVNASKLFNNSIKACYRTLFVIVK